jgi:radical SAM superfamily enzyme YgiQ (UPF0313 family)
MKVLFIYPVPPAKYQILRFQQGIGSLSAVLKQGGHQTELLVLSEADRGRIAEAVGRFDPGLVALSLTSGFYRLGCDIARIVSADHGRPVILGGIHPTLCPEASIAADGVFAICVGEGEYPLLELCDALDGGRDPTGIRNLWVKQGARVYRNELRPLIDPLDALPYPDREVFRFQDLLQAYAEAEFMGSRGCPFRCTYCANHALSEIYRGKGAYVRFRSVDNLLGEIAAVTARYRNIGFLGFHDDTFTLKPSWLREFAEKYPARCRFPFWCNATAGSITEETAALLKQAGCYEVRIGVESGNDYIRMEVLEKPVTREQIVQAFRRLRAAGIQTYSFNMVGLPCETPQTIEDTVRLNQEVRPNQVFCSVFYPYPGTRAGELCRRNGWTTDRTVSSYFEADYALRQPSITRAQVLFYHDIFRDLVRWPRWAWLIRRLHRIRLTRTRSLWNAWRRVRAKWFEGLSRVVGRPLRP